jgi:hypothetical protein
VILHPATQEGTDGGRARSGPTGHRLQVRPQADRTHPRHRRGGPHVSEGDPRRADLRWTGQAASSWIRKCCELPIREPEDVPKVVELFRISYERAKASAERRRETTERRRYSNDEQGKRSA